MKTHESASQSVKIAIIGGGVSGATAAVHLGELGIDVALLEKGPGLVNGPPICHLHAGGNLYREISEQQCIELLEQSIASVRLFPHTINKRPTVIAVPHTDTGCPKELVPRLKRITSSYQTLVDQDPKNQVLGDPKQYYRLFEREELELLAGQSQPDTPTSFEQWLIPFAKSVDLDSIKYPVVAVNEYGWSVFRLAASATLTIQQSKCSRLMLNSTLLRAQRKDECWVLTYKDSQGDVKELHAEYLINACGYQTGQVDDSAELPRSRLVEFKAAYVTQWGNGQAQWPEVIFHGERGTPNGMAQLTPYADGVFQLHGMTEDITLFEGGLVSSCYQSSHPKLPEVLTNKLEKGWQPDVVQLRTERAIEHVARYVPSFDSAKVAGKPLYGAQQIPGRDETLRAADVTFENENYARMEVVKGSSALEAASKIIEHWSLVEDYQPENIEQLHPLSMSLTEEQVETLACELAISRGYPKQLAIVIGER
ncbi:FAD-dependent oxidoreductase [Vibrio sp. SCSIO 43135]|uniref:FAD-dependent oxidoreductase n=1 Tax=Vibrio sp. SCSIO 43135 TaxID=2819096 RepID=UPI00207527C0|nr:FAD-dependent oxidoreductase [Vibrio sp. SCSIO 43135]USD43964.1 FAD-dependent oxidoreductase [Vibrio sp. SCSIO 43135]